MRKYLFIIRLSLLELLEYRVNIPVRSAAYIINIGLNLLLWVAVTKVKGGIFGYDTHEILLYYLFLFTILPLVVSGTDFAETIGRDIKEGNINRILVKPISPLGYYATAGVSQRINDFLVLSPVIIIILFLTGFPTTFSLSAIPGLLLTALIAIIIDHALMGSIGLIAFWTTQIVWIANFIRQIFNLFSGVRFPLNFFPLLIVNFLSFTPIYFLAYFPAGVFLGKIGDSILREFTVGIFWVVALSIIYSRLWSRGLRRYEGVSQ